MPSTHTGSSSRMILRAWNSALSSWNGALSRDSLPLPRALNSLAQARAGNTWPPVPPAMIKTLPRMANLPDGLVFDKIGLGEIGVFAAQLGTPFPLDAQQHGQADAADHQGAAAIAEERQGQALGRQQTDIHADIDQHLADPQKGQAVGHIGGEELLGLLRPQADIQRAYADEDKQADGNQRADHAQLLGQHSKHEVGMGFRQVELLLDAVA